MEQEEDPAPPRFWVHSRIPFRKLTRGAPKVTSDEHHLLASDKFTPTANDKECPVSEPVAQTCQVGIHELALVSVWCCLYPQPRPKGHRPARRGGAEHCSPHVTGVTLGSPGGSVVNNLPAVLETQETWVRSLGQEDPLEGGMATHSSILAWRIPWTEEPGGLQSRGSHRAGHD